MLMSQELAITTSEFEEKVLKSDVPVLVDFWAPWCGPCRAIGPSIEQIAAEYQGKAKVFKVDIDNEGSLAEKYNVMSIPNLMFFKGGVAVDGIVGAAPKNTLTAKLDALIG